MSDVIAVHKVHNNTEPHFDVNGDIIDNNKIFKVNNDVFPGDSVEIKKGIRTISGILIAYEVMRVFARPTITSSTEEYYRYEMIYLLCNNKSIKIDRNTKVLYETELEIYISRVVLLEKYKPFELLKKDWF